MTLTFPNVTGSIEVYLDCLKAICGDTEGKHLMDLCCCTAPNTPKLGFHIRHYMDIVDRKLDHKEEQEFFIKMNVLDFHHIGMPPHQFDVMTALDAIEHFTKEDGYRLLRVMGEFSKKQILFTPLGDLFINGKEDTDPEKHRSGWTPEEFVEMYAKEDHCWLRPHYACIVFPNYHKAYNNFGAFFTWSCENIEEDFARVKEILMTKSWASNG